MNEVRSRLQVPSRSGDSSIDPARICGGPAVVEISFDKESLRGLVREVLTEVLGSVDWPTGRLALDEIEAARACSVGRHVLRDLRLVGKIKAHKLGKKVVYTRADLLTALEVVAGDLESVDRSRKVKGGSDARQRSTTEP